MNVLACSKSEAAEAIWEPPDKRTMGSITTSPGPNDLKTQRKPRKSMGIFKFLSRSHKKLDSAKKGANLSANENKDHLTPTPKHSLIPRDDATATTVKASTPFLLHDVSSAFVVSVSDSGSDSSPSAAGASSGVVVAEEQTSSVVTPPTLKKDVSAELIATITRQTSATPEELRGELLRASSLSYEGRGSESKPAATLNTTTSTTTKNKPLRGPRNSPRRAGKKKPPPNMKTTSLSFTAVNTGEVRVSSASKVVGAVAHTIGTKKLSTADSRITNGTTRAKKLPHTMLVSQSATRKRSADIVSEEEPSPLSRSHSLCLLSDGIVASLKKIQDEQANIEDLLEEELKAPVEANPPRSLLHRGTSMPSISTSSYKKGHSDTTFSSMMGRPLQQGGSLLVYGDDDAKPTYLGTKTLKEEDAPVTFARTAAVGVPFVEKSRQLFGADYSVHHDSPTGSAFTVPSAPKGANVGHSLEDCFHMDIEPHDFMDQSEGDHHATTFSSTKKFGGCDIDYLHMDRTTLAQKVEVAPFHHAQGAFSQVVTTAKTMSMNRVSSQDLINSSTSCDHNGEASMSYCKKYDKPFAEKEICGDGHHSNGFYSETVTTLVGTPLPNQIHPNKKKLGLPKDDNAYNDDFSQAESRGKSVSSNNGGRNADETNIALIRSLYEDVLPDEVEIAPGTKKVKVYGNLNEVVELLGNLQAGPTMGGFFQQTCMVCEGTFMILDDTDYWFCPECRVFLPVVTRPRSQHAGAKCHRGGVSHGYYYQDLYELKAYAIQGAGDKFGCA